MKANILQGIMQSASESESDDDDEESDEDEAKKPATSDKPKRSSRDKERRKNRRKLESKLDGRTFHRQHSDGSPGTGNDDYHEAREHHSPGRQKYRDKDEVNKAKIEKAAQQWNAKQFVEESCSQSRSIQDPMQLSSGSKQMYGHQEETITANIDSTEAAIENKAAEVESISSESKRSNTRDMNSVATALTTGIDAAVPQVAHGALAAATAAVPDNFRG